jgi:hypothetical protein
VKSLLTPEQRKKLRIRSANKRYKAKCVARGDYRKGGRFYREYDPIRDAPRRRRYYLKSLERA